MNELFRCWMYLNSTRIVYLNMKSGSKFESVLWECYTDIYNEVINKYKGKLVRTKHGYEGRICSIYSDSPVITIQDDTNKIFSTLIAETKLL